LPVLKALGVEDAALQVHTSLVLHTARAVVEVPSRVAFCTFDYEKLCIALARQVAGKLVRANVEGIDGQRVLTDAGAFEGRVLIDASGWRATLASAVQPGFVDRRWLFCGVETEVRMTESGLHFWVEPGRWENVLGWVFPCGDVCRVGVGSYVGDHPLGPYLDQFLSMLGVEGGRKRHGGFFPSRLRRATAGHVFVTGDAAGQCYPLSGEGIRPALFFGDACGRFARDAVEGRRSLPEALAAYAHLVHRNRWSFRIMRVIQDSLLRMGPVGQSTLVGVVNFPLLRTTLEWAYDRAMPAPSEIGAPA
jgi:flavin-dependent dehydrogenase